MLQKYRPFMEAKWNNEHIHELCKAWNITDYTINSDGSIDVDGSVNLNSCSHVSHLFQSHIEKFHPLRFGRVTGDFKCQKNKLTTLEGSPYEVGGDFNCFDNNLTSLVGCPSEVGGSFDCSYNQLADLEGCPSEVGGSFDCSYNLLTSLAGCPTDIKESLRCAHNQLDSLFGCPSHIKQDLHCQDNLLTDMVGGPKRVDVDLFCQNNRFTSFDGFPITVGGTHIKIGNTSQQIAETGGDNNIKSFEGFPTRYRDSVSIMLGYNPVGDVYVLFDCDPVAIPHINEWDVIDEKNMELSYSALCEVWDAINMNRRNLKNIYLDNYTLGD